MGAADKRVAEDHPRGGENLAIFALDGAF